MLALAVNAKQLFQKYIFFNKFYSSFVQFEQFFITSDDIGERFGGFRGGLLEVVEFFFEDFGVNVDGLIAENFFFYASDDGTQLFVTFEKIYLVLSAFFF